MADGYARLDDLLGAALMGEIADRYRRRADRFEALVTGVDAEQWGDPSPCAEWDARGVVGHIVDMHEVMLRPLDRTLSPAPSLDEDPLGRVPGRPGRRRGDPRRPGPGRARSATRRWARCRSPSTSTASSARTWCCTRGTSPGPPVRTTPSTRSSSTACGRACSTSPTRCASPSTSARASSCSARPSPCPTTPRCRTASSAASAATPPGRPPPLACRLEIGPIGPFPNDSCGQSRGGRAGRSRRTARCRGSCGGR